MKTPTVFATLVLSSLLVSFTPPRCPSSPLVLTGTYGVCGCGSTALTGPEISLTLQEDHTFHYVNSTDPSERIDLTGRWEVDGNKVRLLSPTDAVIETWTVDENTNCVRSRKGLLFTRLCHLEACPK